jgi:hypothetical protein
LQPLQVRGFIGSESQEDAGQKMREDAERWEEDAGQRCGTSILGVISSVPHLSKLPVFRLIRQEAAQSLIMYRLLL